MVFVKYCMACVRYLGSTSLLVKQEDMSFGQIAEADTRENPFAVLKELKRDQE